MNIEEKLKKVALESLPTLVAGEMKDYIENAEQQKKELEQLKTVHKMTIDDLTKKTSKLNKYIEQEHNINQKITQIERKEKELEKKETELKIYQLEIQLAAAQGSKNDIYNLVSLLVKNPRAIDIINTKEDIFTSPQSFYNSYSGRSEERLVPQSKTIQGSTEKIETKDE